MDWCELTTRVIAAVFIGVVSGLAGFASRHWIEALLRGKREYASVVVGYGKAHSSNVALGRNVQKCCAICCPSP